MKRRSLRMIAAVLVTAILCTCGALAAPATTPTFTDVPTNHWAYAQIERAFKDGVVGGTYYNEATGERTYSPNGTLTLAQAVTIFTRAFYSDEVDASTAAGSWYAKNEAVAKAHELLDGVKNTSMNSNLNRYDLSQLMYNIMMDQGAEMPADEALEETAGKIADWNSIPSNYDKAVVVCYYLGLLGGVDANGTFNGAGTTNRAQIAVVYCRLADAIASLVDGPTVDPEPTPEPDPEPTPDPEPEEPDVPSAGGPVGTLSDEPVLLSLSTHAPIYDYWSEAPAEVRNVTDKDMFNAVVQTMKDRELQLFESSRQNTNNVYYNYACFEYNVQGNAGQKNLIQALGRMAGYGGYTARQSLKNSDAKNVGIITYVEGQSKTLDPIFAPVFAKFGADTSDKEKVEACMKLITDTFEYGNGTAGFNWTSSNKVGLCGDFKGVVQSILNAAGIPVFDVSGQVSNGAHGWNVAYLDGEWYVVDGTAAEYGYPAYMSFAQHEKLYGYSHDLNVNETTQVTMYLAETFLG